MESMVSLEQIEELAVQLPQQEQLKLVARICKRLIEAAPKTVTDSKKEAEMLRRERAREATAILHECDLAAAYCNWAGVQLPTEAQWEKGARGIDGRIWPWRNEWDSSKCNSGASGSSASGIGKTTPVGFFPSGASPYSLMDMAGNVLEWCADWYDKNYYRNSPTHNPQGPSSGVSRALRGGAWGHNPNLVRAAFRNWDNPEDRSEGIGFRCSSLHVPR